MPPPVAARRYMYQVPKEQQLYEIEFGVTFGVEMAHGKLVLTTNSAKVILAHRQKAEPVRTLSVKPFEGVVRNLQNTEMAHG